jgi:hypothetical protein
LHSKQNDNDEHMTAAGGEDVGGTVEVDAATVASDVVSGADVDVEKAADEVDAATVASDVVSGADVDVEKAADEVDAATVSGHKVQAGPLVLLQQGR